MMFSRRAMLQIVGSQMCAGFAFAQGKSGSTTPFGRYVGEFVAKFDPNHPRNVTLMQPFSYIDPSGLEWRVPEGAVVDGASIPEPLWPMVGTPFVGEYRMGSVVHDYFCRTKARPWEAVHKMFYLAMRASGVGEKRAKVMFSAVYYFGPKWKLEQGVDGTKIREWRPQFDAKRWEQVEKWVSENNPSIDEIAKLVR